MTGLVGHDLSMFAWAPLSDEPKKNNLSRKGAKLAKKNLGAYLASLATLRESVVSLLSGGNYFIAVQISGLTAGRS